MEAAVTDISLPAHFADTDFRIGGAHPRATSDFRVGRVVDRTAMVLSRNFLPFFLVTAFAQLPSELVSQDWPPTAPGLPPSVGPSLVGVSLWLLSIGLGMLSQGIVLH